MPPTELSIVYCTAQDVKDLLSAEGVELRQDDDDTGTISATEAAFLTRAINQATAKVNRYCRGRYDPADLDDSWEVNEWTTIIAARWLCTRRGNAVPQSIKDLYDEAIHAMELVKGGSHAIEDIGSRTVDWPSWSNTHVDQRYLLRKVRVQKPISDPTPRTYRANRDVIADYINEPN